MTIGPPGSCDHLQSQTKGVPVELLGDDGKDSGALAVVVRKLPVVRLDRVVHGNEADSVARPVDALVKVPNIICRGDTRMEGEGTLATGR